VTPRWLRLHLAGERLLEGAVHRARGAWDGVWLGLLTPDQLALLDRHFYDGEPVYRSEAHNRQGLFDWETHVVDTHLPAGCRVVVTGAGGGREVLALLARGHDVAGFEPNPTLAAVGATLTAADGHGARVAVSARDGFPVGPGSTDAVVLGWGSYMLVPTRSARVALLRAAAAAAGGGPVLLSYFRLPADRRQFRTALRVARPLRRWRGAEPPLLGDALAPNAVHHFTGAQIAEEAAAAGLVVAERGDGEYGWAVVRAPARTQETGEGPP
jgi:hypothetical protein